MEWLMGIGKGFLTFVLIIGLLASMTKASRRMHSPAHPAWAEYTAGFILFFAQLVGLYYLWWH